MARTTRPDRPPDQSPALQFRAGLRLGIGLAALGVALAPPLVKIARSWPLRSAVSGESMRPLLRPGDWLLIDPEAYRARAPRPSELVAVADPRDPSRWLVKRVVAVGEDGRLDLRGDDPQRSTDSRTFGPVEPGRVIGRPWARYWPPQRIGRIR
jgi:nickel-type superoxide dismutase maturation protease